MAFKLTLNNRGGGLVAKVPKPKISPLQGAKNSRKTSFFDFSNVCNSSSVATMKNPDGSKFDDYEFSPHHQRFLMKLISGKVMSCLVWCKSVRSHHMRHPHSLIIAILWRRLRAPPTSALRNRSFKSSQVQIQTICWGRVGAPQRALHFMRTVLVVWCVAVQYISLESRVIQHIEHAQTHVWWSSAWSWSYACISAQASC